MVGTIVLICNKVMINPKDMWDELVDIGFIENDLEYVAVSRLAYEDEIDIQHNDQINSIKAHYKDVKFIFNEERLMIEIHKPTHVSNMPTKIEIVFDQNTENVKNALIALKASTFDV